MAAPSHHQHYHHRSCRTAVAACCCDCNCCCGGGSRSPPPPQTPQTDPLLHALAAHLLPIQPPQTQTTIYSHLLKPHAPHHYSQFPHHHQDQQTRTRTQAQTRTRSAVAALLRRIDALEASLGRFYPSSSFSTSDSRFGCSNSLRDVAARTIQTHFRAFLVRRSRTLRHLKDLAFVKSSVNALKSSVSEQTHLDRAALSHQAMDLVLKLDSIKDSDPMIRDGRRSISNELVRFLEFLDGPSAKRSETSVRAVKNMRSVHNNRKPRVLVEKLSRVPRFSRVSENDEEDDVTNGFHPASDDEENPNIFIHGKHGFPQARNGVLVERPVLQPKVKKTVRFAENGNLPPKGDVIQEGVSIDDQIELVENLCNELEEAGGLGTEDDEEERMETGESPPNSDSERDPRRKSRAGAYSVIRGPHYEEPNEEFVFSAPVPVKMESRADFMNKREKL